jgi:DNA (cytosine-5)-methyltransferase 1
VGEGVRFEKERGLTTAGAYYNENDPRIALWLRELIKAGLIADGEVDTRSIVDVRPNDLRGFVQCHFFAGIGGWSYALRLAGWPDSDPAWTFSCPCQKFSSASRGRPVAADMWPEQRRLLVAGRPRRFFGEQVAKARDWFDGLCADVEALGYTVGAAVLPAVAVGQDHARPRIYFVGHANGDREPVVPFNAEMAGLSRDRDDAAGVVPSDGIPARLALSGFGNSIVPQVAAEFIGAYMDLIGAPARARNADLA